MARQLEKFNIFGQGTGQGHTGSQANINGSRMTNTNGKVRGGGMSIDHSQEFNFSDLSHSDMKGFGSGLMQ